MNMKKNPEIAMSSSNPKEKNVNFRVLHGYTKVLNPYLNNVKKPRCQTSSAFSSNFMGNRRKNNTLPVGNVLHLDENSSAGSSTGSGSSNLMNNVLDDLSEGFLSIKDVDTNLIPTLLVSDNDQIDLSNLESISTINLPPDCKYDSTSLSSLKLTHMDGTMLSDLAVADLTNNLSMHSQGSLLAGLVTPESSSETAQSFEAVDSNSIPLLSLKENQNDSFDNYNLLDLLENTTIPNNETFEDKLKVADDSLSNENTSLKRKRQTRTRKPRKRKIANDLSVVQEDQNIDSSSLPQEDPTLKKEKKRRNSKGIRAKRSTRNKNSVDSSKVEESNVTVFKAINDLEYDLSKVKAEANEGKSDAPVLHLDSSENKIGTAVIEEIEAIGDFLTCDSEMIDLKPEVDPFGNIPETDPFGNCNDYDPLGSPEPCLRSPNPVVKNEDISCEMDNTVNVSVNSIGESLGKILEKLQKCDTVVLKKTDDLSNLLSSVASIPHVKDENTDNEVIINPNDSSNQIILSTEKSKCDTQNETNFESEKLVVMDNIFSKFEKSNTVKNKTPMSSDADVFSVVKRKRAQIEKILPNPDNSTLARTRKKNSASDKSYPVLRVKKLCRVSLKRLSIPNGVTTVKVKKVGNIFEWTPLRPLFEEKLETIGNLPMLAEPSHCKKIVTNHVTEPMFSDSEDDLQILGSDNNIDGSELFSDEQSDSEDIPLITTDIDKLAESIVCTDEASELSKKSSFKKISAKQLWSTSFSSNSPSTNKKTSTLSSRNKSVSFNQNSHKKVLMKTCASTTRTNAFNKPYYPNKRCGSPTRSSGTSKPKSLLVNSNASNFRFNLITDHDVLPSIIKENVVNKDSLYSSEKKKKSSTGGKSPLSTQKASKSFTNLLSHFNKASGVKSNSKKIAKNQTLKTTEMKTGLSPIHEVLVGKEEQKVRKNSPSKMDVQEEVDPLLMSPPTEFIYGETTFKKVKKDPESETPYTVVVKNGSDISIISDTSSKPVSVNFSGIPIDLDTSKSGASIENEINYSKSIKDSSVNFHLPIMNSYDHYFKNINTKVEPKTKSANPPNAEKYLENINSEEPSEKGFDNLVKTNSLKVNSTSLLDISDNTENVKENITLNKLDSSYTNKQNSNSKLIQSVGLESSLNMNNEIASSKTVHTTEYNIPETTSDYALLTKSYNKPNKPEPKINHISNSKTAMPITSSGTAIPINIGSKTSPSLITGSIKCQSLKSITHTNSLSSPYTNSKIIPENASELISNSISICTDTSNTVQNLNSIYKPKANNENIHNFSNTGLGILPNTSSESKPNFSFQSKPNTSSESKPNSSFQSKHNSSSESKPNSSFESKHNSSSESKPNSSFESKHNSSSESKPNSSSESKPNNRSQSKLNISSESKLKTSSISTSNLSSASIPKPNSEAKPDTSSESKSNTNCESKSNTNCESKSNTNCESKSNTNCESKSNTNCESKSNTNCESKSNTNSESKSNTNSESKSNTNSESKSNTNSESKSNTNSESKSNTNSESKSNTNSESLPKPSFESKPSTSSISESKLTTNSESSKLTTNSEAKLTTNSEAKLTTNSEAKLTTNSEAKLTTNSEAKLTTNSEAKLTTNSEAKLSTNSEAKLSTNSEAKLSTNSEAKLSTNSEAELNTNSEAKLSTNSEAKLSTNSEAELNTNSEAIPSNNFDYIPRDSYATIPITSSSIPNSSYTLIPNSSSTSIPNISSTTISITSSRSIPFTSSTFIPIINSTLIPITSSSSIPISSSSAIPISSSSAIPITSSSSIPITSSSSIPITSFSSIPITSSSISNSSAENKIHPSLNSLNFRTMLITKCTLNEQSGYNSMNSKSITSMDSINLDKNHQKLVMPSGNLNESTPDVADNLSLNLSIFGNSPTNVSENILNMNSDNSIETVLKNLPSITNDKLSNENSLIKLNVGEHLEDLPDITSRVIGKDPFETTNTTSNACFQNLLNISHSNKEIVPLKEQPSVIATSPDKESSVKDDLSGDVDPSMTVGSEYDSDYELPDDFNPFDVEFSALSDSPAKTPCEGNEDFDESISVPLVNSFDLSHESYLKDEKHSTEEEEELKMVKTEDLFGHESDVDSDDLNHDDDPTYFGNDKRKKLSCPNCSFKTDKQKHYLRHIDSQCLTRISKRKRKKTNYYEAEEIPPSQRTVRGRGRGRGGRRPRGRFIGSELARYNLEPFKDFRLDSSFNDPTSNSASNLGIFSDKFAEGSNECKVYCTKCPYYTNNVTEFQSHIVKHYIDTICLQCPHRFISEQDYYQHRQYHSMNKSKFNCSKCSFSTTNQRFLDVHKAAHKIFRKGGDKSLGKPRAHHTSTDKSLPRLVKLKCPTCNYMTLSSVSYQAHLKTHAPAVKRDCSQCDFTTDDEQLYQSHLQLHADAPIEIIGV